MKKNSKQRLFEVMGRLDKTFKPTLNEKKNRWYYNWDDTWSAVISNPFGSHFSWTVEETNEVIPTFHNSDWAVLNTFEKAEDDMFSEIMNRIGHTPKSQKNNK